MEAWRPAILLKRVSNTGTLTKFWRISILQNICKRCCFYSKYQSLDEKCPNMEFFLLRIQSECKKTGTRKNFVFGHFSCSELDKHMSEWSFKGKQFCYWILNITFFWTGFSYDLQYKKLIFLFENLHRAIKLLNDFVNKFVCMFACNGTFLLQTLEEFHEFRKVSPHTWPQDYHSVFSSYNQGKRSPSKPSEI